MGLGAFVDQQNLRRRLGKLDAESKSDIVRAVNVGALLIQGTARENILRGQKTGTVVEIGGELHIRSAPGEAPANDTGTLAAGIVVQKADPNADIPVAEVSSTAPYAMALERGTEDMAARPYMGPAAKKNEKAITRMVTKAVDRAIGRNQ